MMDASLYAEITQEKREGRKWTEIAEKHGKTRHAIQNAYSRRTRSKIGSSKPKAKRTTVPSSNGFVAENLIGEMSARIQAITRAEREVNIERKRWERAREIIKGL